MVVAAMFDVGFGELLFLGIIIIVVLGPDKLPEAIRYAFKVLRKLNHLKSDIQQKINLELELHQLRDVLKDEIQNVQQLESQMQDFFAKLEPQIQSELNAHLKSYYPIQPMSIRAPFQAQFVLFHLTHWPCLSLDSLGMDQS